MKSITFWRLRDRGSQRKTVIDRSTSPSRRTAASYGTIGREAQAKAFSWKKQKGYRRAPIVRAQKAGINSRRPRRLPHKILAVLFRGRAFRVVPAEFVARGIRRQHLSTDMSGDRAGLTSEPSGTPCHTVDDRSVSLIRRSAIEIDAD
jgi:hypothetical protein